MPDSSSSDSLNYTPISQHKRPPFVTSPYLNPPTSRTLGPPRSNLICEAPPTHFRRLGERGEDYHSNLCIFVMAWSATNLSQQNCVTWQYSQILWMLLGFWTAVELCVGWKYEDAFALSLRFIAFVKLFVLFSENWSMNISISILLVCYLEEMK